MDVDACLTQYQHSHILGDAQLVRLLFCRWPGGTQSQLHTIGIELDRIVERVTARPPTAQEAQELGITEDVAVLVLRKTCVDIHGRAVEVSDIRLPGDGTALVFTTPLDRW